MPKSARRSAGIDQIILELYEPAEPRHADEFTVNEAAELWHMTYRWAGMKLSELIRAGKVSRRTGKNAAGRTVHLYRVIT